MLEYEKTHEKKIQMLTNNKRGVLAYYNYTWKTSYWEIEFMCYVA